MDERTRKEVEEKEYAKELGRLRAQKEFKAQEEFENSYEGLLKKLLTKTAYEEFEINARVEDKIKCASCASGFLSKKAALMLVAQEMNIKL